MFTDPIADMLTRIRNAQMVGHASVEIPASRIKVEITKLLLKQGYVQSYEMLGEQTIRIFLKYNKKGEPVIKGLQRISKPGLRVYATCEKLPRVIGGSGTAIISTSSGILSDHEARKAGVGGEVLCFVY